VAQNAAAQIRPPGLAGALRRLLAR
jgi:hypothetical protein